MSLPTSFLTSSNSDRKREREEEKRLERERQQYNPRECTRELNPYWKNGGDGLPNFKKPEDSDDEYNRNYEKKSRYINRVSNWKKNKESERKKSLEADKKKCTEKVGNKVESNSTLIQEEENVLSEKELNVLAAKLVKAEIMGNTKLVNDLKKET
ncbi:hypothetical protein NQ314_008135 [Rhamnusium bicolor]|uniref:Uncharacterized protein n=1 Tax=Rhamnusium bicolor TaxID=1586634 RepID=A0AAV8YEA0_9CUCU|nr:hypothetical protein NQ314_008135 [Rhamnusium bicolor]